MCPCSAHSFHLHLINDVCLVVCWLRPRSVLLLFSLGRLLLLFLILPVLRPALPLQCQQRRAALSHNEECCPMATYHPPTFVRCIDGARLSYCFCGSATHLCTRARVGCATPTREAGGSCSASHFLLLQMGSWQTFTWSVKSGSELDGSPS